MLHPSITAGSLIIAGLLIHCAKIKRIMKALRSFFFFAFLLQFSRNMIQNSLYIKKEI